MPESAPVQPPQPPQVRLGIDESRSTSLNWLGYAEETEHAANQGLTDQSAMTPAPGAPKPQAAPQAPAPKLNAARPAPMPMPSPSGAGQRLADALQQLTVQPSPSAAQSDGRQQAAADSSATGTPGLTADKESTATSVKKAPAVRLGKVLAANGLDIQTKSPRWSYTTLQLRQPKNPTVEITFGSDGRVLRASFVTDGEATYNTGFDDVDQPLLSAIYSWTARGDHLAELTAESGEVTIRITVILVG